MTKERPPVSIENALYRVLGELGIDRAAEITGRGPDYLRSMSDPDTRYRATIEDAIKLDLAYRACRPDDAATAYPIFEAYGLMLEAAGADRFATAEALQRQAVAVVLEGGEAGAALIRASLPNATAADRAVARRELEQSIAEDTAAIRLLSDTRTLSEGGP